MVSLTRVRERSLVKELYGVSVKAEIINGEIVRIGPNGAKPGRAAGKIYVSLVNHEETVGGGYAFGDNVSFIVSLPNRSSFSRDAAWYTKPAVPGWHLFVERIFR